MWSFLSEFTSNLDGAYTVVVMDERGVDRPRRYEVHPRQVLTAWGGSMALAALLMVSLVVFTPVRQLIPGYGTEAIRQAAQANDRRVAALSDSLQAQQRYIRHLRSLITGEIDTSSVTDISLSVRPRPARPAPAALPIASTARRGPRPTAAPPPQAALDDVPLPMRPPVEGFPTRGFDARAGHFAVDIAVESGTPVRSVGDGYVILADWTQSGGYTVAVQHARGFVSVYKHNKHLLKRAGDRVRSRETLAVSGNTGEITSGPHVHFELWKDGLAQNPSEYFVGW